jgi:hypothetical protein
MIYDLRFTIWKRLLAVWLLLSAFCFPFSGHALTSFYQYFYNADGTPQTNVITGQAYPAANTWTVVGTNMFYGLQTITLTPTTNGYVSNAVSPNGYRFQIASLNTTFYANIPNTTNVLPLATYVTNVPVISGTYLNGYSLVTNWTGFAPATNSPATNTIIYVSGVSSITNASGVVTNLTVTFGTNTVNYQQR